MATEVAGHNSEENKEKSGSNGDILAHATSAVVDSTESDEDAWSSQGNKYINPFVHRLQIRKRIDWAKIYVLTVLLLPIRIVGCVLSLISAWMFACIGIYGLSLDELKVKPFTGWRKHMRQVVAAAMRMVFACGSFHYITIKGERAAAKQAPIMVVAPHSSYVDSIVVVATGPPSIVAKKETSQIPLLGKIINFAQPIYVQREDPNSRQNTIREIVTRARSADDWPQVVIFAEGTCTNRTALIKFKPGAFYPGVPVQPVLLKYPNKYDTFTWTWDGPGFFKLLWLTMCQFYNHCEIEYLPVYNPSDAEKADANLYAKNVRDVMAKALGVPTSEYSFEDVTIMSRAKDMKIPFPGDIVEIERTLYKLNLLDDQRTWNLANDYLKSSQNRQVDMTVFANMLQIDENNSNFKKLFKLLDHQNKGVINLKSYLLCYIFCKLKNEEIINFLQAIIPIYSLSSQQILRQDFNKIMRHASKITAEKSDAIFVAIDKSCTGKISFDEFKRYTHERSSFAFLFKTQEQLRNTYKKRTT